MTGDRPRSLQLDRVLVASEQWPLKEPFSIARGTVTEVTVVTVRLVSADGSDPKFGEGECRPYARYGETPESVMRTIDEITPKLCAGIDRDRLRTQMKPGAARNAIDSAMLDLESKQTATPPWKLLGLQPPRPIPSAFTISMGTPEAMADAAMRARSRPLLKLKLGDKNPGGNLDIERVRAIRAAVPETELIVDANEGWNSKDLPSLLDAMKDFGVTLVEQPLKADGDQELSSIRRSVVVCADESVHGLDDLPGLRDRYDAVNIKLDKTGGPTEAAEMLTRARELDLKVMVGCMVSTSLAIRPAAWLARDAEWADLDAPLLLGRDRDHPVRYDGSTLMPDNELHGRNAQPK